MAYQNEQVAVSAPEQQQGSEELVGLLEASVMNGDLRGAVWAGQQILGLNEASNGAHAAGSAYTERTADPANWSIRVRSLGNDRSGLLGSRHPDPVEAWQDESRAGRGTSPRAMVAMQTVLRDSLGRYGWHYSNARQYQSERHGRFVGASMLGSDLQMRVAEFDGPGSQEHLALAGFMQNHGYRRGSRTEEPRLLQWCDGLKEPEERGRIRARISSLLGTDPRELSRLASTDISAPQVAMRGLARTGHPYPTGPTITAEMAAMLQGLDRDTEVGADLTLAQTVAAYYAKGEAEQDRRHSGR